MSSPLNRLLIIRAQLTEVNTSTVNHDAGKPQNGRMNLAFSLSLTMPIRGGPSDCSRVLRRFGLLGGAPSLLQPF